MDDILQHLQRDLTGEFLIERELGGGGMSRVFLAEEVGLGRRVVIKVLPPELAGSVSLERFRREIQVAAGLQHPHIVPMLRAGRAGELLYYSMPFVDGESLRGRLARGPVEAVEAARILRDVADALAYAHRRNVAHRDVKPDNILLADGHAYVTDFGVARALNASGPGTLTASGIAIGTPLYMAPEQAAGDPLADHRVDLYALGVVAWEMLVGEPPFSGDSPQAILAAQLTESAAPVRRRAPATPPELAALVDHCLLKDPNRRTQSADELMSGLAAVATPTGGRKAAHPPSRLVTGKSLLAAALAVMLLVLAGAEWRARGRASRLLDATLIAAREGRFDDVAAVLSATEADPGARRLRPLAALAAGRLLIETPASGTRAEVTRVSPIDSFAARAARDLGELPVRVTLVVGQYLVRLRGSGSSLELLATVSAGAETRLTPVLAADTAGSLVSAGGFLIGRTEVTSAEYQRFVAAGGYRNAALWPEGGEASRFVDRTGVPGPADWSNGAPPPGQEQQPVTGISWYEASAYARWAGQRLPTIQEWYRAALGEQGAPFPWGTDGASAEQRANFGGVAPTNVASHRLGVSPFGAHDMAGNVREWVSDPGTTPETRLAVGGSWQEPPYGFEQNYAESLTARARRNVLGFRLAGDTNGGRR